MKRIINYTRYFIYLWWYWSFKLAYFVLKHEIRGEKKYGVDTLGIDELEDSVSTEDLEHASIYQPINYYTAETLFNQLTEAHFTHGFLDAGCGKGRAIAMAAYYGLKEIHGFDFSPKLVAKAQKSVQKIQSEYPGTNFIITEADARFYKLPVSINTIFLFNPFDAFVMEDFIHAIQKSVAEKNRTITVLYANPVCKSLFVKAGFEETFYFQKMKYIEGVVLTLRQKVNF